MTRYSRAMVAIVWLAGVAASAGEPAVPLFEGLGTTGRKVTTSSADAQRYFDQGLCFLFAFNHDEAIRSFHRATELDPDCPLAWWGIALAHGPHINFPLLPPERNKLALAALTKAQKIADKGTASEQALIAALATRYAESPPEDRRPLDEAYAAAMRKVWQRYPDDADIGSLFAESLMDLRPWDLWLPAGKPQPGTDEVVSTLERVLALAPRHPLAIHLYIHAVEASSQPERAIAPADRLRDLQPGLGHLVHMPSHIDVRIGSWKKAILANAKAIEADARYRAQSPQQGFYRVYMAHNHHMLAYAAIMRGQSELAIKSINNMAREMPAEWVKENAAVADGFAAIPLEVLVRFGRWKEVLEAPEPPEYLPFSRAMRHCARGIAFAALADVEKAGLEQSQFLLARAKVPADGRVGNNAASDVLAVAEMLLAGEILVRAGKTSEGLRALQVAVEREDRLRYSEPPDWIHPVRHALGATLLSAGRAEEAEQVYRADLQRLPNNGWSLYGLSQSLHLQKKENEAKQLDMKFSDAWSEADVKIKSSCFCQPGK
jgi:tetratricopeptide (TPR) repeat protein